MEKPILKEIRFYKEFQEFKNKDYWYCFGNSSCVTINDCTNIDLKLKEMNTQKAYSLYLTNFGNKNEDEFWKEAKDRNFVFLTFLRINEYSRQKVKIDNIVQGSNQFNFYYSLDSYDLVIAKYADNINEMDSIFNELVSYGITILETNTCILSYANQKNYNIDNEIPLVSCRFRLKHIELFNENIKENLTKRGFKSFVRSGNYDLEFFRRNYDIKSLFELLNKNKTNMIFGIEYLEFYKAVAEFEIKLYSEKNLPKELIKVVENNDIKNNEIKNNGMDELVNLFNKLKTSHGEYVTKDLQYIYDFMIESINKKYINDIFCLIYSPMKKFLSKYIELLENKEKYKLSSIKNFYDYFIDSIHDLFLIYNNSRIHASRGFSYKGDKINIPFKLLNFYTQLALEIKKILQDTETDDFCFILVPSIKDDTKVICPLEDDDYNNRLLFVQLPIAHITSYKLISNQLAHEIAHYVCNKTRLRKVRANELLRACVLMIENHLSSQNNTNIEKIIKNEIHQCKYDVLNSLKENEIESNQLSNECKLYYRNMILKIYPIALKNAILYYLDNIKELETLEFKKGLDLKIKEINFLELKKVTEENIEKYNKLYEKSMDLAHHMKIEEFLNFQIKICDESFSDIAMIKVMNLTIEEYFDFFINDYFVAFKDEDMLDFVISRISLVLSSVFDLNSLDDFIRKKLQIDDNKEILKKIKETDRKLSDNVKKDETFKESINLAYIIHSYNLESEDTIDLTRIPNKIKSSVIFLHEYLKQCAQEIGEQIYKFDSKVPLDKDSSIEKHIITKTFELNRNLTDRLNVKLESKE